MFPVELAGWKRVPGLPILFLGNQRKNSLQIKNFLDKATWVWYITGNQEQQLYQRYYTIINFHPAIYHHFLKEVLEGRGVPTYAGLM
jgi:hypothetical protein